jgi:glyoxylase-like metal-dependent hydrolase (beta-lactamase superfamily II)
MVAIHTPGDAKVHLCFARPDGVVFTADHVMSWSSSIVSPPNGDMADYCESLRVMIARNDALYLPGHGPPLANPRPFVEELLARRVAREEEIAQTLRERSMTPTQLAEALYSKTDPWLKRAAERNVIAHLHKLARERRVRQEDDLWTEIVTTTRERSGAI